MAKRIRAAGTFVTVLMIIQVLAPGSVATAERINRRSGQRAVVDLAVSFDVVNKNDSRTPCLSDRREYTVRGHLTGPGADLEGPDHQPRLVTELLTGWDEGEWAWRFRSVPGYDYATEMAKLGLTSLTIDMLGYGSSGHPPGGDICWGSQADVNHQIVQQLRDGTYRVDRGRSVPFSTVLVSARDVGPLLALKQEYTWGDIDGISSQVLAHQGFTPYILDLFARRQAECAQGGEAWDEPKSTPPHGGGYVYFGPQDEQFRDDLFDEGRADPAVIDAVLGLRNRNPCGMVSSTFTTGTFDVLFMSEIEIPVLLVFPGPDDPVITRDGQEREAANYGSTDVTTAWMDSGHFMELEACAHDFRALTAHWIHERWGVGSDVAMPTVGADQCVTEVRTKEEGG